MRKVIVCGSRDCPESLVASESFNLWSALVGYLNSDEGYNNFDSVIVGGARGADTFGKRLAETLEIPVEEFLPDWETHGKSAGIIRNIHMLDQEGVDLVIALWDGSSKGTKHMIDRALKKGIDLRVIFYKDYI